MHPKPRSIAGPIKVERHDCEGGAIAFEVMDYGSDTYHRICTIYDSDNNHAKQEAEFVALALNNAIGALMAIERSAK